MGLQVEVIGPTGFRGSYLCVELLNRGHQLRGISRRPEKLGSLQNYTARVMDIEAASYEDLINAFQGLDVLVNEYGQHTAG